MSQQKGIPPLLCQWQYYAVYTMIRDVTEKTVISCTNHRKDTNLFQKLFGNDNTRNFNIQCNRIETGLLSILVIKLSCNLDLLIRYHV